MKSFCCFFEFFYTATQFFVSKEHFHCPTSSSSSFSFLVIGIYFYGKMPRFWNFNLTISLLLVSVKDLLDQFLEWCTLVTLSTELSWMYLLVCNTFSVVCILPEDGLSHIFLLFTVFFLPRDISFSHTAKKEIEKGRVVKKLQLEKKNIIMRASRTI